MILDCNRWYTISHHHIYPLFYLWPYPLNCLYVNAIWNDNVDNGVNFHVRCSKQERQKQFCSFLILVNNPFLAKAYGDFCRLLITKSCNSLDKNLSSTMSTFDQTRMKMTEFLLILLVDVHSKNRRIEWLLTLSAQIDHCSRRQILQHISYLMLKNRDISWELSTFMSMVCRGFSSNSMPYMFFEKAAKFWNCRLMQIMVGALWVKSMTIHMVYWWI